MKCNFIFMILVTLVSGCSTAKDTDLPLIVWNSKDASIASRVSAAKEIAPVGVGKAEAFRRLDLSEWSGHWSSFNDPFGNGEETSYFLVGYRNGDVALQFAPDGHGRLSDDAKLLGISAASRRIHLLEK